jgi:hypothetical protein
MSNSTVKNNELENVFYKVDHDFIPFPCANTGSFDPLSGQFFMRFQVRFVTNLSIIFPKIAVRFGIDLGAYGGIADRKQTSA